MSDQQLGDLPAQLERWQNAAYSATERADALHEQKLDLQAIIGKQEEELRLARSREVALELRVAKLSRAAETLEWLGSIEEWQWSDSTKDRVREVLEACDD